MLTQIENSQMIEGMPKDAIVFRIVQSSSNGTLDVIKVSTSDVQVNDYWYQSTLISQQFTLIQDKSERYQISTSAWNQLLNSHEKAERLLGNGKRLLLMRTDL